MPQEKPSGKTSSSAASENDLVPLTLRIPKHIHARLKEISEAEYRSLNHQIIMALAYFVDVQEKLGALPNPEALKKALPAAGSAGFPAWIRSPGSGSAGRKG